MVNPYRGGIIVDMKFLLFAFFSTTFLMATSVPSIDYIELERGACYGTCPMYEVKLLENGDVTFIGKDFVTKMGEQKGKISPNAFAKLADELKSDGVFHVSAGDGKHVKTDHPTVKITISLKGQTRTIIHNLGDGNADPKLTQMENKIDKIAETSKWTGLVRQ